jgi:hypothetical protein
MIWLFLFSCQNDACEQLCNQTSLQVQSCMNEWSVSWEHLSVPDRSEFRETCENQWMVESAALEWREQEEAQKQCELSADILATIEDPCAFFQQIYFYDP